MIELNPLTTLSKEIRSWYESIRNDSASRNQAAAAETQAAVSALSTAILETRTYVNNGFSNRDMEREAGIRNLWNEAHLSLKRIKPDLATRCFAKAEYWTEPENWSSEKVAEYQIGLDSLRDALVELEY